MSEESKELAKVLYADLPSDAVTQHPTKTYLSSIKGIYVTDRLNKAFGVGGWSNSVEVIDINKDNGMVVVKVTVLIPSLNAKYECFGGNDNGGANNKNFDLGDAFKGATTDAITKIGSWLGIGHKVFKGKATTSNSTTTTNKSEPQKPWLNKDTKEWNDVVTRLQDGAIALNEVYATYAVNKANREELKGYASN